MLHGYIGVGKTTFARQLERHHAAVRFTHDEWISSLYGADPPEPVFREAAERVDRLMHTLWTRCLTLGINVVLDTGFWSRTERLETQALVARCGAEAILYQLNCSDDIARERIARRNQAPDASLHVAPSTYEALKTRFEPLTADEPALTVTDWTPPSG